MNFPLELVWAEDYVGSNFQMWIMLFNKSH